LREQLGDLANRGSDLLQGSRSLIVILVVSTALPGHSSTYITLQLRSFPAQVFSQPPFLPASLVTHKVAKAFLEEWRQILGDEVME
jgi:hypothetical protein